MGETENVMSFSFEVQDINSSLMQGKELHCKFDIREKVSRMTRERLFCHTEVLIQFVRLVLKQRYAYGLQGSPPLLCHATHEALLWYQLWCHCIATQDQYCNAL